MMEAAAIPGWKVLTAHFDCGRAWGIAIQRTAPDGAKRRYAVRVEEGFLTRDEAITRALPALRAWIDDAA